MKISEVAKLLDLPISTIRYYEKMGVLPDDLILRDKNKYRVYTLDSINYLRVLKAVLDAGFSISEVKNMISINGISDNLLKDLLETKILEIEDTERELEKSKKYLQDLLTDDISCEHGFGRP